MLDALQQIHRQVMTQAIGLAQGLVLARAVPGQHDLGDDSVHPLAQGALRVAAQGHVWPAVVLWRLVLEALDHAQTPAQRHAVAQAGSVWITLATYSLSEQADGRLLADAQRRGEKLLGGPFPERHLRHQLGVMWLDPYLHRLSVNHTRDDAQRAHARWRADAKRRPLDLLLPGDAEMPPAPQALGVAIDHLEQAVALRQGRERGLSLKALVGAQYWLGVLTDTLDREAVAKTGHEALALLDPEADDEACDWLTHYLQVLDPATPRMLDKPKAAPVQEDSPTAMHAWLRQAASASTPDEEIADLLTAFGIARRLGDEPMRLTVFGSLANAAAKKHAVKVDPAAGGWAERGAAILQRAEAEQWAGLDRVLVAIWLSQRASAVDAEAAGMDFLQKARDGLTGASPELWFVFRTALAVLQLNAGATDKHAQRPKRAFGHFLRGAESFLRAEMPQRAAESLQHAVEMFYAAGDGEYVSRLKDLSFETALLQTGLAGGQAALRRMGQLALGHVAFRGELSSGFEVALQAAKGRQLALWRRVPSRAAVLQAPAVQSALAAWREARALPGAADARETDLEALLQGYDDTTPFAGADAAERFANLQRNVDRTLSAELARASAESGAPTDDVLMTAEQLRAALPEGTVLLSVIVCPTPDKRLGFVSVLVTRERVVTRLSRSNEPINELGIDGRWSDDVSPVVAELRRAIQRGEKGEQVEPLLASLGQYVFGGVEDDLKQLHAAGYRYLCIHPFGGLHYAPLPLLTLQNRPIADDWVVTHLPSLGLLAAPPSTAAPRQHVVAFGCTFEGEMSGLHGLGPLREVADEVQAIADETGGFALLDQDATPSRWHGALEECRFVHLATHGGHNPFAPALQAIYLHPEPGHDGVVHAFEMLGCDLDGLELMTLSACETALGRIDAADNPRGLQAFLFAGGVRSIVSCLWPVHDDTARHFFTTLYRELAQGASRLDAFAAAQRGTREQFPDVYDWGVFQYSGV